MKTLSASVWKIWIHSLQLMHSLSVDYGLRRESHYSLLCVMYLVRHPTSASSIILLAEDSYGRMKDENAHVAFFVLFDCALMSDRFL